MSNDRVDEWTEILTEIFTDHELDMSEDDVRNLAVQMDAIAEAHVAVEEARKRDPHGTAQAEAQYYGKDDDAIL